MIQLKVAIHWIHLQTKHEASCSRSSNTRKCVLHLHGFLSTWTLSENRLVPLLWIRPQPLARGRYQASLGLQELLQNWKRTLPRSANGIVTLEGNRTNGSRTSPPSRWPHMQGQKPVESMRAVTQSPQPQAPGSVPSSLSLYVKAYLCFQEPMAKMANTYAQPIAQSCFFHLC